MIALMRRLFLAALALASCKNPRFEVDQTGFAFGSYVRVRAIAESETKARSAVEAVLGEFGRLDSLWSGFVPTSEVSLLNRSGRAQVSNETRELLARALWFCAATEGALDITVQPLVEAWGFADGRNRVPGRPELEAAVGLVDYRRVELESDSVVLNHGARLDLGAVAVGYAVDRAAGMLMAAGVKEALIDAGGDIRVFGERKWRIGLANPRSDGIVRVFEIKDGAVSTSGDYQRCFEADGQRYHHIIDPDSGYPARGCASTTVFAPSALTADAYSTAFFVLGPEKGLAVVEGSDSLGVVILVEESDSLLVFEGGRLP